MVAALALSLVLIADASGPSTPRSRIAEPLSTQSPLYRKQHAVLIGINEYRAPQIRDLEFATADAKGFRDVLQGHLGFEPSDVQLVLNGTRQQIDAAVNRLTNNDIVKPDDLVFVFFAGHGVTVKSSGGEAGFLVPSDASVNLAGTSDPSRYVESCIRMEDFWQKLELCQAKHKVLIAEACFGGVEPRGHVKYEPKEQPLS